MTATHQIGNGFTMLLGGARSGKSDLAVKLATEWDGPVLFAATAEASDDDMADRIGRHQAQRPEHWGLVESPMLKGGEVADCDPSALVIVDCITLLVNNLIFNDRTDDQINEHAKVMAHALVSRSAPTLVISNEVGLGVVPETELGRRYRDVLGRYNRHLASRAQTTLFIAAGKAMPLLPVSW